MPGSGEPGRGGSDRGPDVVTPPGSVLGGSVPAAPLSDPAQAGAPSGSPVTGGRVQAISAGFAQLSYTPVAVHVEPGATLVEPSAPDGTEDDRLSLEATDPLPAPTGADAARAGAVGPGTPLLFRLVEAARRWIDDTPSDVLRVLIGIELALLVGIVGFQAVRRRRRVRSAARAYAAAQVLQFAPAVERGPDGEERIDPVASWIAALADEQARARRAIGSGATKD